ncbi:hypothetical protein BWQ96_04910 [Gracilariopsis chorda]|uniref:Uncharacterized protein n=1 Tax=Gracilariopsis chorda TaxID=448386 RepID=A0A2V3IW06_9FLOR|nr:hypothetical protein BWQ96_04910 [Gracilariopsis chorda]|eukprot:PXF45320.1 hypothetical protein BWQ96_04910 [Gracilariopsis chorda]
MVQRSSSSGARHSLQNKISPLPNAESPASKVSPVPSEPGVQRSGFPESYKAGSRTLVQDVLPNIVVYSSRQMMNRADGSNSNANKERSSDLNGIIKVNQGRKQFCGGFDEDLRQFLEFYDVMARLRKLTDQ